MAFDPVSYAIGKKASGGSDPFSSFIGNIFLVQGTIYKDRIKMGNSDNVNLTYFAPVDDSRGIVKLDTSKPFEIGITMVFHDITKTTALCGQVNSANWGVGKKAPSIVISSNGAYCAFALPGSSDWLSVISPIPSEYTLPEETEIFFKASYDGEIWSAFIDDGTEVMETSEEISTTPYYNASNYMIFANQGMYYDAVPKYAEYIFSKKLYMKQNGILIWGKE